MDKDESIVINIWLTFKKFKKFSNCNIKVLV